ncbi:hypothetical protein ABI_02490 [Asticcacaulis biprosthecium C19]|uniref:Uncharacterized protein n=1 Tax=Asticcacaulis biprosthecium C19 TaxID=715226 RepID=F4QIQ8_9CAUL|nr:hypothetical protein [Asticcacaulis biprosthecium]EGF91817.1 hypothetical protein ABI_02490 [Asticcacaulis biprosthecium C19]
MNDLAAIERIDAVPLVLDEIAKAHGGELTVQSTDEETVFRFRMSI